MQECENDSTWCCLVAIISKVMGKMCFVVPFKFLTTKTMEYREYFMENAVVRFVFTRLKVSENELTSERSERVSFLVSINSWIKILEMIMLHA